MDMDIDNNSLLCYEKMREAKDKKETNEEVECICAQYLIDLLSD